MQRPPIVRLSQLAAGVLLMVIAPITAPLPGPAATFLFVGGLLLVLRNSHWARVRYVRAKSRYPRAAKLLDRTMRRRSAMRRRQREQARQQDAER